MSKKTKISLIVTSCVLAIIFVTCMIYYFGASFKNFYAIAEADFNIPGLDTKFVPQGLDYNISTKKYVVSGYMSNEDSSRFYIVDKQTNKTDKYFTLTVNGEDYKGHAGGIVINGDYAWTCGDGYVYRFNFTDALNSENKSKIPVIDYFKTNNGADFLYIYNNRLIVGEFYKKGKYETPQSHWLNTDSGETNKALAFAYLIDLSNTYGLRAAIPDFGISLPNQVQGICQNKDNKIILSTSFSLPSSKILRYKNVFSSSPSKTLIVDNLELPVYVLCNKNLEVTIDAPCMSEEIVLVDDKVVVLFENKCAKYRLVTRTRLDNAYALDI